MCWFLFGRVFWGNKNLLQNNYGWYYSTIDVVSDLPYIIPYIAFFGLFVSDWSHPEVDCTTQALQKSERQKHLQFLAQ